MNVNEMRESLDILEGEDAEKLINIRAPKFFQEAKEKDAAMAFCVFSTARRYCLGCWHHKRGTAVLGFLKEKVKVVDAAQWFHLFCMFAVTMDSAGRFASFASTELKNALIQHMDRQNAELN